jgi:hypothetical protein
MKKFEQAFTQIPLGDVEGEIIDVTPLVMSKHGNVSYYDIDHALNDLTGNLLNQMMIDKRFFYKDSEIWDTIDEITYSNLHHNEFEVCAINSNKPEIDKGKEDWAVHGDVRVMSMEEAMRNNLAFFVTPDLCLTSNRSDLSVAKSYNVVYGNQLLALLAEFKFAVRVSEFDYFIKLNLDIKNRQDAEHFVTALIYLILYVKNLEYGYMRSTEEEFVWDDQD